MFVSVLPAVRSPCDQPRVLPEVQQLSPVRSPGQHAGDSGLQLEPGLSHARTETVPACRTLQTAGFLEMMFSAAFVSAPQNWSEAGGAAFVLLPFTGVYLDIGISHFWHWKILGKVLILFLLTDL